MSDTLIHPYEKKGLGVAPYRTVNFFETDVNSSKQRLTEICAYCGSPIMNIFVVQSADEHLFFMGSTCVEKVDVEAWREGNRLRNEYYKGREAERMALLREQGAEFMNFGKKHNGSRIADVLESDPAYIIWVAENMRSTSDSLVPVIAECQRLAAPLIKIKSLEFEKVKKANKRKLLPIYKLLKAAVQSDFVDSMISQIDRGFVPSDNALFICCQIAAKVSTDYEPRRSKAAKARYEAAEAETMKVYSKFYGQD